MTFKRFTKLLWLRSIGREALTPVFGRFAGELAQRGKALPPAHLDDDAWLSALGFLLLAPESLPDELNDTLFVIEEMATGEGQDRLLAAAQAAGLALDLGEEATPGDVAIQVWLKCPDLLIRQHARLRELDHLYRMENSQVVFLNTRHRLIAVAHRPVSGHGGRGFLCETDESRP